MKANCPFCSPSILFQAFTQSDNFLAIINIAPILPGHSLIIPKKHLETIHQLTEDELSELFLFSRNANSMLMKTFGSEGFDWSLQESEAAGQSIAHLHLHIIPRKTGDLAHPGDWFPLLAERNKAILDSTARDRLSPQQIGELIQKIKSQIDP